MKPKTDGRALFNEKRNLDLEIQQVRDLLALIKSNHRIVRDYLRLQARLNALLRRHEEIRRQQQEADE